MEPIFDHDAQAVHRRRAQRIGDDGALFLMRAAADELADRLSVVERRFGTAAALFCGTGDAARAIAESGKVDTVTRVEAGPAPDGDAVAGDPEIVPFERGSLGLAVALHALDAVNDVPGFLIQTRQALRPDGLFLGCMAGAGTLGELNAALIAAEAETSGGASARVHPFADVRDVGGLLQRAGFALPVADVDTVTVRYDSMFALIADLRAMGVSSALLGRRRTPPPRALFFRAAEIYAERFSDPDGRVRATFSTIWMSGWAPDASQQKPLAPGSGEVSLAKVLGQDRGAR